MDEMFLEEEINDSCSFLLYSCVNVYLCEFVIIFYYYFIGFIVINSLLSNLIINLILYL